MDAKEHRRFDLLRTGPCVPPEYVEDYYSLPWPLPAEAGHDFEIWRRAHRRRPTACDDGAASRYDLEAFLQQQRIVPKKWMGARLGMTVGSLNEVLSRLQELGMRPQRYVVYEGLIAESLPEDLIPKLPKLRFRTFADHNSFCERLHADLRAVLAVKVQPLFCATSDRLEEYPRRFADSFDCLTLAPLSGRHQLWLDFHKPLLLGPDRCSKLFYAENREELRPYLAGHEEPDDLDAYTQFFASHVNG